MQEAQTAQEQSLEIARQEQQIAVHNKSREERLARAEADEARAKAVAAKEQVTTARETEVADRGKRIELIDASKEAEVRAIGVKVEAEKEAAANRAEVARIRSKWKRRVSVQSTKRQTCFHRTRIHCRLKLALLKVLPEVVSLSAKPLCAIDSIKIVQVEGITQNGGGGHGNGGSSGNLATDAVAAALSYRAQAPVIDGLMKELGLDGSSLDKLASGGSGYEASKVNDGGALEG